jgi:signal transduction histidine kinase
VLAIHDVTHLAALDRMKSRFVANVSHELRTPVTTIKLYAHLMRQYPERWREYLLPLAQEADHQARLVQEILQISRMEAGRLEIVVDLTSLDELTKGIVSCHQVLAQEKGLTLEYHLSTDEERVAGPVALIDPERMMQAVNNLVGNAIRYTPPGGAVTISTGEQEAGDRRWATVTVTDTGIGIPEDELPYIFERFFRGEEPREMQPAGTGLGLSIAKEIVELHGGHVTVESEKGVGSVFTIWLPLAN